MNYKKILLTGGAGFIGSHLCQLLLKENQQVRIFDLPHVSLDHLPVKKFEVFRGDISKYQDIEEAMHGCDLVVHLAGNPNLWAPDSNIFDTVNRQGTQNVLDAAKKHKVKKVIHVSTESILISNQQKDIISENTKTHLEEMVGPYCASKWRAEEAARRAQLEGQNVVILSPTIPIGANDFHMGPLSRVIRDFCQGKIKAYMEGVVNVIDVRDIAEGIWVAAMRDEQSHRYLLGNENWTILELFEHLSVITGIDVPKHRVPYTVALSFAWIEEKISPLLMQRPPMATTTGVKLSHYSKPFDASHTIQQLGLELKPCHSALEEMVKWMKTEKII